MTGLTLQDLINAVAYQEAHPEEAKATEPQIEIDFEDSDTQAVIRAVQSTDINKMEEENEDGR